MAAVKGMTLPAAQKLYEALHGEKEEEESLPEGEGEDFSEKTEEKD